MAISKVFPIVSHCPFSRRKMLFFVIVVMLQNQVTPQDLSFTTDIRTLSELPLHRLLEIKKTFYFDDDEFSEFRGNLTAEGPQALALQSKKRPKDRDGSYHTYHYVDESPKKSSKTQSIFQISVTTLAFLAFGGYLICLLVQAVKGKSNYDNMSTATQIMSALVNSHVRRRSTRRPQRLQNNRPSNGGYRRKRPRPKRAAEGDMVETLYYNLINLSEGYTKYHTMDYLHYNSSVFNL